MKRSDRISDEALNRARSDAIFLARLYGEPEVGPLTKMHPADRNYFSVSRMADHIIVLQEQLDVAQREGGLGHADRRRVPQEAIGRVEGTAGHPSVPRAALKAVRADDPLVKMNAAIDRFNLVSSADIADIARIHAGETLEVSLIRTFADVLEAVTTTVMEIGSHE